MRSGSLVRAAAFGAALTLIAAPRAASADDEAAATELFNAGRDLMRQGDFAAACPKLAESVRLEPTVGALAKLAFCEEHERRLVSARARWEQALNLARSIRDPREGEAAREFARVDAKVPKLVLHGSALPSNARIRVGDLRVGPASLGVSFAVEPGPHPIEVSAPGKKAWSTIVEGGASGKTIAVEIPPLEDAPAPPPLIAPAPSVVVGGSSASSASLAAPDSSHPPAAGRRLSAAGVAGLGVAAAGVVVLGIGAVLGFEAIAEKSDAGCAGTTCRTGASAHQLEGAQSSANRATAALIVGGVLAAGGVALWVFAPRAAEPNAPRVEVRGGLGTIALAGRF